ncbi:NUDIX hydrolase [Candidatus Nomurabacteria bacterium]|nr:NUDIX hydrolase [Candidatus Nomurabacteria bacterium]
MPNFFKYPAKNFKNQDIKISINSGPVIIGEDGRFLLHISSSTGKYQFTGGRLDDSKSPKENAIFRPKEDVGLEVELIKNLNPLVISDEIERNGEKEKLVLIHYLAKLKDGFEPDLSRCSWFTLDEVKELEKNNNVSSPNILIGCKYFTQTI